MEINKLKPQESYYLNRPLLSDPIEMLKYALLGLHIDGHIDIFYKKVYINKNAKYPRSRIFVRLGSNYKKTNDYTSAEYFLLSKIDKPELRFYEFRNAIANGLDNKINNFRMDYVYEDLCTKQLVILTWLLSRLGRSRIRMCKRLLKQLDKKIDLLLDNETELQKILNSLGANIIFLKDKTLKKLNMNIINLDELNNFFDPKASGTYGYISYGAYYGGSGGSFGGGGGFSGFGGGAGGGGGSGGGW